MPQIVYILHCAGGQLYVGRTGDLRRRLAEHNEGLSEWTASRRPVRLVYFEEFESAAQAMRRERSLKNGRTRRKTLERMISDFPERKLASFA